MNGAFGGGVALKIVLELFNDRRSGKEAVVISKSGVPDQDTSVLECRNLVADDLDGFRRNNGADGFPNFF